jgi:hypothetical protein
MPNKLRDEIYSRRPQDIAGPFEKRIAASRDSHYEEADEMPKLRLRHHRDNYLVVTFHPYLPAVPIGVTQLRAVRAIAANVCTRRNQNARPSLRLA